MKPEERGLLAALSRHIRETLPAGPWWSMPIQVDDLTRVAFDADGITLKRRTDVAVLFPEWGTRYPFRSVTEGVDLAVALGLLPVEFSSAYRQGLEDAHSEIGDDESGFDLHVDQALAVAAAGRWEK